MLTKYEVFYYHQHMLPESFPLSPSEALSSVFPLKRWQPCSWSLGDGHLFAVNLSYWGAAGIAVAPQARQPDTVLEAGG